MWVCVRVSTQDFGGRKRGTHPKRAGVTVDVCVRVDVLRARRVQLL